MATRSNISIRLRPEMIDKLYDNIHGQQVKIEGEYMTIYCHFDGYLSGVGETLFYYYNSFEKAFMLILGGDISSISETLGDCDYYASSEGWCKNVIPKFSNLPPRINEQYLYIFEDEKWYVFTEDGEYYGPLGNYIEGNDEEGCDTISLPKDFCQFLHGYLSGLSMTNRDKNLESIIKKLGDYLNV